MPATRARQAEGQSSAQRGKHAAQRPIVHLRIHAHGWTARQNDLDQAGSLGGSGDDRSAQAMRFAQDIDAGETCRFVRSSTQQLMAPGIQQSRIGFSIPLRARARARLIA